MTILLLTVYYPCSLYIINTLKIFSVINRGFITRNHAVFYLYLTATCPFFFFAEVGRGVHAGFWRLKGDHAESKFANYFSTGFSITLVKALSIESD